MVQVARAISSTIPLARLERRRQWGLSLLRRAVPLAALLAVWEALPDLGIVHPIILAPPSAVIRVAVTDWPVFAEGLRITLLEAGITIAISWTIGLGLGFLLGSSAVRSRAAVRPLEFAFAMPWVVLFPLLTLWAGIGSPSKVVYATIAATFPILLSTIAAIATVDGQYVLLARSLGASRAQIYAKILLPSALPRILAGLQLGTAVAIIAVVTGEMLVSVGGLGFVINFNRTQFATGHVYLGLVMAVALTQGANWVIGRAKGQFAWWAEGDT